MSRRLPLPIVAAVASLLVALPAEAAVKLTIPVARERAASYAENTCAHDSSCAGAGVQGCRRQAERIVLCRIFDHRMTDAQGNFVCTRLIRLALDPGTRRVPVTGVSDWSC